MSSKRISAVVLTKNEENNIKKCLRSISWCAEVIIIDDYSQDKTVDQIKNPKIKIFPRHLNGDFASQRNYGLSKAQGDWVLFIDADEAVSYELQQEIKQRISDNSYLGYYIRRRDYFLNRWLKHGETGNIRLLRLAKKEAGLWKGRVHEIWEVKGNLGELKSPILHYPHPTIAKFLEKINWYTDIVAQYWKEEGRRISFWEIVLYPTGKFINNYFIHSGFLDGVPGLIISFMMSFHSFLTRSKLWLLMHKK